MPLLLSPARRGSVRTDPASLRARGAPLRSALHRGAASLLRGSAKVADPTATGAKISWDTDTRGGHILRPRFPGPAPCPSLPGAAGRGGSARLRGGGGERPLPPDTPARTGVTPGRHRGCPRREPRGSARQGLEATPGVPPASEHSLCRVFFFFLSYPLLLPFNFFFFRRPLGQIRTLFPTLPHLPASLPSFCL